MSFRRHRGKLGRLVTVRRPVRPIVACAVVLLVTLPFAVPASFGPPGPGMGLLVFVLLAVPLTYGFGEWLFLQHRVYEHGIILRSLPGLRTFVIPFHSIAVQGLAPTHNRVHDGGVRAALAAGSAGSFRVTPLVRRAVRFDGLAPDAARMMARGSAAWPDHPGNPVAEDVAVWVLSDRDPEVMMQLLRGAIASSRSGVAPPD